MDKFSLSRNLGFITGPLLLVIGILSYMKNTYPALSMIMIIMGLIRIGLTVYSYVLHKRSNQE